MVIWHCQERYVWKITPLWSQLEFVCNSNDFSVFASWQFFMVSRCPSSGCAAEGHLPHIWGRSFSFFAWNLPIMVQQKPIFWIFKKSNMTTVMARIIQTYAWVRIYVAELFNFRHETSLLWCNKNPYFKFAKKMQHGHRYGNNLKFKYRN